MRFSWRYCELLGYKTHFLTLSGETKNYFSAFTIVELLVVIVAIGVLAAVSTVGYGTWRASVGQKEVESDITNVIAAMDSAKNWSQGPDGGYPVYTPGISFDGGNATKGVFTQSANVTLTYGFGNNKRFCIEGVSANRPGVTYFVNTANSITPTVGKCEMVTTIAGHEIKDIYGNNVGGYADGTGSEAAFKYPSDIAIDKDGNIYTADNWPDYYRVRKITPQGTVTTIAGTGAHGTNDGPAASATFLGVTGLAVDENGNIFLADYNRVRKIDTSGIVSTITTFSSFALSAIVINENTGDLYVFGCNSIYKVTQSGGKSRLAGNCTSGYADGAGTTAMFYYPSGMTIDKEGNIYIADHYNANNNRIRKVTPEGVVTTIAGSDTSGSADGAGQDAQFSTLQDITVDSLGNLYVTEYGNPRIRKITSGGVVTTFVGGMDRAYIDGAAKDVRFVAPHALTWDKRGYLYLFDSSRIRRVMV